MGDWIIGTGSRQKNKRRGDFLVYVMRVTETMTFNEYWENKKFHSKKANLRGSKKQAFGDNIYFKNEENEWEQLNSHHSHANGKPNRNNIHRDTQIDKILVSEDYAYWGDCGPKIPSKFREWPGYDLCKKGPGYKNYFPKEFVDAFVNWFRSLNNKGRLGEPLDWKDA